MMIVVCMSEPDLSSPVSCKGEAKDAQRDQCRKPPGLIKTRKHVEFDRGPLQVPHAVPVGGNYFKCVAARPHVRVVGSAARPRIDPFTIQAFQLVFEPDILRADIAKGSGLNLEVLLVRLNPNVAA